MSGKNQPIRVTFIVTCFNDTLLPNVGIATTRLLERLGLAVDFPEAQAVRQLARIFTSPARYERAQRFFMHGGVIDHLPAMLSATSDIEFSRVEGMHGQRPLHVFVVLDS